MTRSPHLLARLWQRLQTVIAVLKPAVEKTSAGSRNLLLYSLKAVHFAPDDAKIQGSFSMGFWASQTLMLEVNKKSLELDPRKAYEIISEQAIWF